MRRVVGAVCIGHKSGSTNFLLQAIANKVSRRALLNHHFVVPLLRGRMLLRILCVHHGSFVNDPYEVLLGVIKISLFLVCRGRRLDDPSSVFYLLHLTFFPLSHSVNLVAALPKGEPLISSRSQNLSKASHFRGGGKTFRF